MFSIGPAGDALFKRRDAHLPLAGMDFGPGGCKEQGLAAFVSGIACGYITDDEPAARQFPRLTEGNRDIERSKPRGGDLPVFVLQAAMVR